MSTVEMIVSEMFSFLLEVLGFVFTEGLPAVGKFLNVLLWGIAGAIIVPCLLISNVIYPVWEKWGENLKS